MKNVFALVVVVLIIGIVSFSTSQVPIYQTPAFPKSYAVRSQQMGAVVAMGAPFTTVVKLNLSSANWGRPDSLIVSGVYFARFTNMKFRPTNGDTLTMPFDSLTGLPIAIDTVFKIGTDSLSRTGNIFIICNQKTKN